MRTENTKYLQHAAKTYPNDPIALAVRNATEIGIVVPSILRRELEAAGFTIVELNEDHAKEGFRELQNSKRVVIKDGEFAMIAHGISDSVPDALLTATLGYIAELDIAYFGARLKTELHQPLSEAEVKADWPMNDVHRENFADHLENMRSAKRATA